MSTTSAGRKTVSVSLPTDLLELLDRWATTDHVSRSSVVERMMTKEARRREQAELEQAYAELTDDGFYDDNVDYLPAQAEVALANPK